jgi:TPR repeat protein
MSRETGRRRCACSDFAGSAAEQGYTDAQFYLGLALENGTGGSKNEQEAVRFYRLAAEQGYARAQVRLGSCLRNGVGVGKDEAEADHFFHLAAKQGMIA